MDIYDLLEHLNIKYEEEEHKKVYTVEEAENLHITLEGIGCKNLFLTDHKHNYYLVLMVDNKRCDLKKLSTGLNVKKLSFASTEKLEEILKLEKGSVTPLGIINDTNCLVKVVLDRDLVAKKLLVHPNRNDRTISIDYFDLIRVIGYTDHEYVLLDI